MANQGRGKRGERDDAENPDNDLLKNLFPDGVPQEISDNIPDGISDGIAADPSLSGILDGLDGIDLSSSGLDSFPGGSPRPGTSPRPANSPRPAGTAPADATPAPALVDNSPVTAVQRVGLSGRAAVTHTSLTGTGTTSRKRHVSE